MCCRVQIQWALGVVAVMLINGLAAPSAIAGEKTGASAEIPVAAGDWPWWRGPHRNGIADPNQSPPTNWNDSTNIVWSVPVPGRGHGSCIVVGDQVVLAAADAERDVQSLRCHDKTTGKLLWETVLHQGGLTTKVKANEKSSLASSTPACDGTLFFINFMNGDAIWTSALDRNGKQQWQTKITDYTLHQGFGSSPTLYKDLVLVSADNKSHGAIAALNRATGAIVWSHKRPQLPNYPSPILLNVAGKDQLFLIGCDLVTSLNPLTGEVLWEIEGSTTECVTSTVTDGKHIFTSGGYPKNHMSAVAADGSGKVVWENTTRSYVPSLLARDGYLYAVLDAGVATCLRCDTGEELWKGRLGGTFSASPVMVGDRIYATNEAGETSVFSATPEKFELIASNRLGDNVFATPTICGGRIYMRIARMIDGKRQEFLVAIGH